MKLKYLPLLLSGFALAQFNIQGELKNYVNKPVLIKMFDSGSQRLLHKAVTDSSGKFTYKVPFEYQGKLVFETIQGGFEMLSSNHDIIFYTDVLDADHQFVYQDKLNKNVQAYNKIKEKQDLKQFTLQPLLNYYNEDSKFHQDLQEEISRINALELPEFNNEAIAYYLAAKEELAQLNASNDISLDALTKAKSHLLNDAAYLESFGLINEFLTLYVSNSIAGAKTREQAEEKIGTALDNLLKEVEPDTPRGQALLTILIPMLEGNGFNQLSSQYLAQASNLTCEISPELAEILTAKSNVQLGIKAPNIHFKTKQKGAKSLYDIKADQKLVIFWASWCPHCVKELPFIKEFYTTFNQNGGEIIAISLDLDPKAHESAIKGTSFINYSDYLKWDSPLVKSYGVTATPTMFLLDKNNKVIKSGSKISEFIE